MPYATRAISAECSPRWLRWKNKSPGHACAFCRHMARDASNNRHCPTMARAIRDAGFPLADTALAYIENAWSDICEEYWLDERAFDAEFGPEQRRAGSGVYRRQ